MKFSVQFNEIEYSPPEINSGEILVETAGYIDSQTRIEQMILAGQRLDDSRLEYDFYDGEIDEDYYDPTRELGFDMADASMAANDIEAKVSKGKKSGAALKDAQKAGGSSHTGETGKIDNKEQPEKKVE